ncbi:MAG: hypothetical protein PHU75_02925 [Candidatus Nanopelagicales bacterium]|nr:hypothetical protein [Candidatus Nanopelagicales bacterium]
MPEPLPAHCESLLTSEFGASECHSVDASGYEGATFIRDLNSPFPDDSVNGYDVVLDFGTLEHVFDVRTAFDNVASAARLGGTIAHVLPANQQCGHGFYQFSPEFFFTLYADDRGFNKTEVYIVRQAAPTTWYRVPRPAAGERVLVESSDSLYVVSIAVKGLVSQPADVQQSDYRWLWDSSDMDPSSVTNPELHDISPWRQARRTIGSVPLTRSARDAIRAASRTATAVAASVSQQVRSNAQLEKSDIDDLIARA